jgi:hypothetical protein
MSARFLTRLTAIERLVHLRDRQVERAREAEEWRQATEAVREHLAACLRGELSLPEAGEGSTRSEWSEVHERFDAMIKQTRKRLLWGMGKRDEEPDNSTETD